jgi:hypothetical protein
MSRIKYAAMICSRDGLCRSDRITASLESARNMAESSTAHSIYQVFMKVYE